LDLGAAGWWFHDRELSSDEHRALAHAGDPVGRRHGVRRQSLTIVANRQNDLSVGALEP
jgi:hypothetical protein